MLYLRPAMDIIRFELGDILTTSNDLPIITAGVDEDADSFDAP